MGSTEVVLRSTELIQQVHMRFQIAQSQHNCHVDRFRLDLEFYVGDMLLLKVSPWKGVIRFRNRGKLGPRYYISFKDIAWVGRVVYFLELPKELSQIYNNFHVSQLRKFLVDDIAIVPLEDI